MDQKKCGLDLRKSNFIRESIEKEDRLRLNWFRRNEEKLTESANAPLQRQVPEEIREELRNQRKDYHKNREYNPKIATTEADPPVVDPRALYHVMRPIDPDTYKLLYSNDRHDNRVTYLAERVKTIPEKRYYLPETTSFQYGWNMWESAKDKPNYGFGRCQIIKDSFYRRNNVRRDPDWYSTPARLSPTVCNCL